ncbi:hypothetical protein GE21DRAFT_8114 [Neurospora crassa]|uniref:Malate dehydrogenase n=2 Tax=Neurospora crassa TaxID=5141 RepID=F5HG64_NEUCR|nr:malate dehydrogenase [Neurospora crassa OR74A]EAA32042.2 malate dehydrogenase [Neurospora crassa OR74A]KHE87399.1 hypothetical protein GE21DRAFT_8114 [Neurospora crassa]CAC28784.2 putative protein [Neurospora crassa]|eukprot:XP_961278.2 malate dehydrogenase [Neurospora crassa OR74A]
MRASLFLSALSVSSIMAAPLLPEINAHSAPADSLKKISEYFNLLAVKIQQSKFESAVPTCDLSKVVMPQAPSPLPPPSFGLTLRHVALGRGTQNYTCDPSTPTAAPVANGAVASLFNASCIVSAYPDIGAMLSTVSLNFNLSDLASIASSVASALPFPPSFLKQTLAPTSGMAVSGAHYFTNASTPFFNMDASQWKIGEAPCAKNSSTPAPEAAPRGQQGEKAVAWLKLVTRPGATGGLQEVYRVETAGGSAPETCQGMPEHFEVQYAAQYWFYGN